MADLSGSEITPWLIFSGVVLALFLVGRYWEHRTEREITPAGSSAKTPDAQNVVASRIRGT